MSATHIKRRKGRYNLTLSTEAHERGHALAKRQNRSFSNLVESLVLAELSNGRKARAK
jgi:hypothetical protein